MGIPLLDSGYGLGATARKSCGVRPHYKLAKHFSNFVLKFLFNALAKKTAAERVSRINQHAKKE
jgi:hypothetical protein